MSYNKRAAEEIQYMSLEKATTPEGLRVYVDTMPDRDIAKINAFVNVGSIHEPEKLSGISHALEHCTSVSTESFPNEEALYEFAGTNSLEIDPDTYYNRTCYNGTGPYVEPNFKLLGEVLFRATFDPKFIPNELSVISREIQEKREDIDAIHSIASDYALFGKPYGRSFRGYPNTIKFTSEQLYDFYKRHYVVSNMALVAVGNVRMEEVMRNVEKYFEPPVREKPSHKLPTPRRLDADTTGLLVSNDDNAIIRVSTAMDRNFSQKYLDNKVVYEAAIQAIRNLCFQRFRRDAGISYDSTVHFYDLNDRDAWSIGGNATVDPGKIKKARSIFMDILSRPAGNYSESAIKTAIGNTKSTILSDMDSVEKRTELYIQDLEHHVDPVDVRSVSNSARNLSPENVRVALDDIIDYFDTHPPVTHITGPKKAVKSAGIVFKVNKIA